MYAEGLAVFLGNQSITTVRTGESDWCRNNITGTEGLTTDFALELTVTAVVVVNVVMRSATKRAYGVSGNGFTIAALNWFNGFAILPLIVFEKELPVLFDKGFDDRKFINLEFLVPGGMGIIKSPLF